MTAPNACCRALCAAKPIYYSVPGTVYFGDRPRILGEVVVQVRREPDNDEVLARRHVNALGECARLVKIPIGEHTIPLPGVGYRRAQGEVFGHQAIAQLAFQENLPTPTMLDLPQVLVRDDLLARRVAPARRVEH